MKNIRNAGAFDCAAVERYGITRKNEEEYKTELEALRKDMVAAMKAKDKVTKEAVSSLISAVKKVAIDEGCRDEIKSDLVDRVILKELKTVKEQLDTCPESREDLKAEYQARYDVIAKYAPKQMDAAEVKAYLEEKFADVIAKKITEMDLESGAEQPEVSFTRNPKVKDYLKTASYYYPNWDQALAEELIKKFELNTKQRINKMSKGMLSMVTIIVALASKADFTFMDEPVAGLDVVMRDYFYHKLMEEYTETGRTFVISTHIIEEATDLMEEVVMIKNGEVLLKENTQELLERSYHVSGLAEVVDQATEGYERHHEEKMGRSKSVTILLEEGQKLPEGYDVTIQPLNLEKLFVSLCGMEE